MKHVPRVPRHVTVACSRCGHPALTINGAWLRQQRVRANLGLREFARKIGVSAPFLSDVERNRRTCSKDLLAVYETLGG